MERMRAQRSRDRRSATERDDARPAPPPAAALLALQRGAGNRAVAGLLQRIDLRRDRSPAEREQTAAEESLAGPNVAAELSELPLSLNRRLLDDIGATTIRKVVSTRLLLAIARAYANDAERILKLLDHLSEGEVAQLKQIAEDYSDAGFARFLNRHPIAVKRAIRVEAGNGAPPAREPGTVVVAAAAVDMNDFILHAHIDYALAHVGGTVQFAPTANLSRLDDDGTLYIVEHGGPGSVGKYGRGQTQTLAALAGRLTHAATGLPPGFRGKIKITTCYSSAASVAAPSSAIDTVRAALNAAGRHAIDVIGVPGPSITNVERTSKYQVVDATKVPDASYLQNYLLGDVARRSAAVEGRLNLGGIPYGKYQTLRATWLTQRAGAATLEDQSRVAATLSRPFYDDFVLLMQVNNMLLPDPAKKQRVTS
jgi:hypothetical protein